MNMTLTSWLKNDHEIKKMIIYINVMIINVNNREKIINTILIYVNFMLIYVNITDRQTHQKSSSEPHKSNISVLYKIC
jgi:hypothetical protein